MSLFTFDRYRPAFSHLFSRFRESRPGWSTASLAEKIRVQPSHLTNVVKGRAHFTSDQIFALGSELGLSELEITYLDELMQWERAEFPERKKRLADSIQKTRDENLRADKNLKAKQSKLSQTESEHYWLDPNVELVHLFLGMDRPPADLKVVANKLSLPLAYVEEIVSFLQRVALVSREKGRWVVEPVHQHLAASSPLTKPQQMLKRVRAMEVLQRTSANRVYSFAGTLTMDEETRLFIQAKFVDFLKEVEGAVLKSPAEKLYHLQFDLFPWLIE